MNLDVEPKATAEKGDAGGITMCADMLEVHVHTMEEEEACAHGVHVRSGMRLGPPPPREHIPLPPLWSMGLALVIGLPYNEFTYLLGSSEGSSCE